MCLSKFLHCFASALTFKSCQNNPENLSIHFAVSAPQGKWLDISLLDRREMQSLAGAPRGAAQALMEGDKGSNAFLQQKMPLFLSATSLHTAVQTAPLPCPPLCPLPRAQTTFNSPVVSVVVFVLDVFGILTTKKSLQLYHFLQAVVRPCKAASGMEMVHRRCQQGEEGAARETSEKYMNCCQHFPEQPG